MKPIRIQFDDEEEGSPYVDGILAGEPIECLVDTGATVSIIGYQAFLAMKGRENMDVRKCSGMISIDHTPVRVVGKVRLDLQIGDVVLDGHFKIAEIPDPCVLGMGLQKAAGMSVDQDSEVLTIRHCRSVPFRRQRTAQLTRCCRVLMDRTVTLQPQQEILTVGFIEGRNNGSAKTTGAGLIEAKRDGTMGEKNIMVARGLVDVGSDYVPIRMMNTTTEPVTLYQGTPAGTVTPIENPPPPAENSIPVTHKKHKIGQVPSHVKQMYQEGSERLSKEGKQQLTSMLNRHSNAFSKGTDDLGRTHLVEHEIQVKEGTVPIRQPARRFPFWKQSEAKDIVQDLRERDLIEPSTSPWASPVVMVRKKDNSTRLCVDYRRLNASTIPDAYPLPRIDDSLDALGDSKYFCTLDLASGYWQVGMTEDAKKKSAFITTGGLWEWKVMPFGLSTAPGTFERLMETVLAGLQWEKCLIYLDDVIVFGKTEKQTLDRLDEVLTRIEEAGLKLKPGKCVLFKKEVKFLGHLVTENGIATDPEKIKSVREWATPTSQSEVRSFYGTASYYRRFVKDFGSISKPLSRLMEKDRPFVWTAECQEAFDTLKNRLIEAPILAYPRHEGRFVLDTDASGMGIGAVLSQVQGEQERVIAYASRGLSKSERNYSVTKRELLAVVTYCRYFRHYLIGREFLTRTDHKALEWLGNFKEATGMLMRWQAELAQFNMKIEHRPGRKHGNADGLSRIPCEPPKTESSSETGDEESPAMIQEETSDSPEELDESITCIKPLENSKISAITVEPLWSQ